jgi:hypothetical protein
LKSCENRQIVGEASEEISCFRNDRIPYPHFLYQYDSLVWSDDLINIPWPCCHFCLFNHDHLTGFLTFLAFVAWFPMKFLILTLRLLEVMQTIFSLLVLIFIFAASFAASADDVYELIRHNSQLLSCSRSNLDLQLRYLNPLYFYM